MPVKFGSEGVNSPDDLGQNEPLPGRYHVMLQDLDESMSNPKYKDCIRFEFQVLNGTMPGQAGKTHSDLFGTSEKAIPRLQRLAMVLGLLGPNEPPREIMFQPAIGRQLVIEVEDQTYQGKTRRKISYMGMWAIGHPDVSDVPLDKVAFEDLDKVALEDKGKTPTEHPAATGGGGSEDSWDDI